MPPCGLRRLSRPVSLVICFSRSMEKRSSCSCLAAAAAAAAALLPLLLALMMNLGILAAVAAVLPVLPLPLATSPLLLLPLLLLLLLLANSGDMFDLGESGCELGLIRPPTVAALVSLGFCTGDCSITMSTRTLALHTEYTGHRVHCNFR